MTREQFDKKYNGKAVWCKTEVLDKEFLELAHSVGYTWTSKHSLLDYTRWKEYEEETVYIVHSVDNRISYDNLLLAKNYNYDIVEFKGEPK